MRIADQVANRLKVLKAIRSHAPLSRSDLPALTGLSRATITQVAGDLVRRGFLDQTKAAPKRRAGRPRTYLRINPRGAVVVGISFLHNGTVEATFVDLAGNKLFVIDMRLSYPARAEDFASGIAAALEEAVAASPFEPEALARVGIAIPALVDSRRGIVHRIAIFPAVPVPFAETISERLGLPVTVEHEVVSMARAEHWFGRAQDLETFSLLYVGPYIGSADFKHGLPRLGANGLSSEVGHIKTAFGEGAPPCFCGRHGCVSAFSSIFGMVQRWGHLEELSAATISALPATFEAMLNAAEAGDAAAVAVIDQAAVHLGIAVANHINSSDPGTMFILMDHPRLPAVLAKSVQTVIEQNILDGIGPLTRIVFGMVEPEWRWKGAAALALEKLYIDEQDEPSAFEAPPFGGEAGT